MKIPFRAKVIVTQHDVGTGAAVCFQPTDAQVGSVWWMPEDDAHLLALVEACGAKWWEGDTPPFGEARRALREVEEKTVIVILDGDRIVGFERCRPRLGS